jgi:hypothetical protein
VHVFIGLLKGLLERESNGREMREKPLVIVGGQRG